LLVWDKFERYQAFRRHPVDERIKDDLRKRWSKAKSAGYLVDKNEKSCFERGEQDRRALALLEDLTKKLKRALAARVKSGYDRYGSLSRESDPGWTNASAHSRAQAFDVFYADGVEIAWQVSNDA
jgi:hypothetical protein